MDNNLPDLKLNETAKEGISDLDKLTQSYLLLKKRISGTHELIKRYNDKLKECDRLKQEVDTLNKQTKEVTCNYNSSLAKVIKLELQNTEYKKNIETLSTQVNDHNIKTSADQQYIQQLICKIKDIEENQNDKIMQYDLEKSSLQVRIKELEQELKTVKKSYDMKMKKIEKKLSTECENKTKLKDIGINTTLTKDIIIQKPEVTEKSVLTDEFYNVKSDLYPIFCSNCEILLEPPPLEKICKIMSNSCPKLIEKISSPPKRSISPIEISIDVNNEQCKTENLPILSDTSSSHSQNQNSHINFNSTNLLPSHTISLNHTDYCNTFSPTSNLINQSAHYIESKSINSLSLTNSNTTNNNTSCANIITTESSLAIISSLQKRIDTLEKKVKRKLNKKKSDQSNNCCHNHYPNTLSMYDINNSMQFNFIELWKKMIDFSENKKRKNIDMHKTLKKYKLFQLKRKRLRNTSTNSWIVESIGKKIEQSPVRKKSKKCKYRYSSLFNKSDNSLNRTKDLEKSNSESDADFGEFNSINSKTNINSECESISHIESSSSLSNSNNTDINEVEIETVQNTVECSKSVGGETDSGILSDSIESSKLIQLETDTEIYSELIEQKNLTEIKSSTENASDSIGNIKLINESPVKTVSHIVKFIEPIEKNNTLNISSQFDKNIQKIEHTNISKTSQCEEFVAQIETNNSDTQLARKRKINNFREIKKISNRQKLLKKLRNLKKRNKVMNPCQLLTSEHRDLDNYENSNISQKKDSNIEIIKEDDYIPKKKSRIAHVPKIEHEKLNDTLHFKKQLIKDIANITNSNKVKEDNNELQEIDSNKIEESQIIISSIHSKNIQNTEDSSIPAHAIVISDVKNSLSNIDNKNSFKTNMNNCDQSDTVFNNIDYNLKETIEPNEIKTESSKYNEHKYENNSLNIKEINKMDNMNEKELLNSNNKSSTDILEINYVNENLKTKEISNNILEKEEDFSIEHKVKIHGPLTHLKEYIDENKCKNKKSKNDYKKLVHVFLITDKFVRKQLQRLIDSDWNNSIHWDVIEKLKSTCSDRIIAKGIIDFLSIEQECNINLDKNHTPPAPLMSKSQQRISALLVDLEKSKCMAFPFVQAGIEYKLFRLNQSIERYAVESLARMYTILARIKKDREKIRIFCCDALYCLGLNAIIILYTVFTCWPEVFRQNNDVNTELLPKCMAHLILIQQGKDFPKLNALKNLVSVFYKYQMTLSQDLLKELLTAFQKKCYGEVETAIILLAKREGTAWTYKHIIKGALLSMIINNKFPSTYRAFCLLGNLMRVFPIEDKDNSVGEIIEQLCDLINSGSDDQKEGVVSALLSLVRHKFEEVTRNILKWNSFVPLHDRTIEQIKGLFNMRDIDFWKSYLKKNKLLMNS
ncbi:uncharacterized protein PF11_0213-like isoform X2 [Apis laboriosa]|uniref:uncharacterized protein PF11_0213-like isoform X2 n=1 Tax=Apis laboriosa TaxID=183418 RepID=UPI001CC71F2E|nr:uncharacterized protein PF11_0213-like isoform X2 [Apis laboriosa]